MRILGLRAISKEESYIYYIDRYKATVIMEVLNRQVSFQVNFSIEINPLGMKSIDLEPLPKTLDYPVLPITKSLKQYITELSNEGKLP
ncbi:MULTISPECIES: hypothetical protein [Treponema]|jgi:hypothetical protein|uniref:Uncharacterized protein n=1 Tax=Treponema rectale TaxID=744512 RepID=A0A840SG32_9SPIR|nr:MULTISPECIES: hypothetical protein [Treponema]MBB5218503.1 hypothetical protein [Treponema rectale]MBE6354128.1 hypothetical protein [Treponema sp.]MBO6176417.1 hypothetical protein [Treponema sp.]